MTDPSFPIDLSSPLIVGFGVTGQAVARALVARSHQPTVLDDNATAAAEAVAANLGLFFISAPGSEQLDVSVASASVLLPSPGIPDHHPVFALAAGSDLPVHSEFDLAACWDQRPVVAITGTNGKTTATVMVADALTRSGIQAEAVGNTPVPLVAALANDKIEMFVVEASSFRLAHSQRFSPLVATWMNFSPDHLDSHSSLDVYLKAKASIWHHLEPDATAVANVEDQTVMDHLPHGVEVLTFGLQRGDWRVENHRLVGPSGPLLGIGELPRSQPHDLANAACVAATATAAGASSDALIDALVGFRGLPHRLELVGQWHDVSWYNDSKATVPQAAMAAIGGFDSVVLIAGGKNKGLDLSELAGSVPPVHSVVAIGDAADEVAEVFAATVAGVHFASSMAEAIDVAAGLARPDDVVLLSPACTSFDWYSDYGARGDDFTALTLQRFSQ